MKVYCAIIQGNIEALFSSKEKLENYLNKFSDYEEFNSEFNEVDCPIVKPVEGYEPFRVKVNRDNYVISIDKLSKTYLNVKKAQWIDSALLYSYSSMILNNSVVFYVYAINEANARLLASTCAKKLKELGLWPKLPRKSIPAPNASESWKRCKEEELIPLMKSLK